MTKVLQIATFELNDENLLEEWKQMSTGITIELQKVPGFISRKSASDKDGKIYCVLVWESKNAQEAMRKKLESPEMADEMKAFSRIANMQTMTNKMLEIF